MDEKELKVELEIEKIADNIPKEIQVSANICSRYSKNERLTIARYLYNAGVRFVPEGTVVLSKQERKEETDRQKDIIVREINRARKETAKEILQKVFNLIFECNGKHLDIELIALISFLCDKYGVEVDG